MANTSVGISEKVYSMIMETIAKEPIEYPSVKNFVEKAIIEKIEFLRLGQK